MELLTRLGYYRSASSCVHLVLLSTALALAGGCAGPRGEKVQRAETPQERYRIQGERITANPMAFLREILNRCDALEQYELTFYRQERLGMVPQLTDMEHIKARFRKKPFSVKFEWDSPDADYYESVYVAGQNADKLIVRERKGFSIFPPQVRQIDVDLPVKIGRSKNPITNFGLAQVTRRTLAPFEDPNLCGVMSIHYEGVADLTPMHRPAHHLVITRPKTPGYRYTRQDFFVDAETLLPAGTDLWLPNGDLDARYRYTDVNTDVRLTNRDFKIRQGKVQTRPATQP